MNDYIYVRRSSQSDSNRLHVHIVVLTNKVADGIPEDIQKNETRAKLPSATETLYTDDEHWSSVRENSAIDENGELDEDVLNRMVEERRRTKRETEYQRQVAQLREQLEISLFILVSVK